ncbi:unnamed protein product [Paramecium sonneborni]|uniref:Uncharacterized protein n=1 Tax=Paramecium sonneborni TaxID=65129 RepID=A0A8S1MM07_9CILI|nr:unnamed protein product [Paramecium sonneborni]
MKNAISKIQEEMEKLQKLIKIKFVQVAMEAKIVSSLQYLHPFGLCHQYYYL